MFLAIKSCSRILARATYSFKMFVLLGILFFIMLHVIKSTFYLILVFLRIPNHSFTTAASQPLVYNTLAHNKTFALNGLDWWKITHRTSPQLLWWLILHEHIGALVYLFAHPTWMYCLCFVLYSLFEKLV